MDKQKSLTKETPILIYGAGEVGNNCSRRLRENGFNIIAVLDANKCGEHIVEGICTYKLGTEPNEWNKENFIVVICLANGMIHKTVADKLYDSGYCYIVFLPMNYCIPDKEKRSLTRLYNHFLSADSDIYDCVVSDYGQYILSYAPAGDNVLSQKSKKITVWMNLEMLFTESIELWEGDKTKINGIQEYNDKNIASQYPVENIFDYFDMDSNSYELYFKIFKKEPDQGMIERELRQREELYRLFKREHGRGMDFFIEAAPEVVWNPKNYCNLVGGHHRTLFLLHEGHSLFPVKMRLEDFNKWENKEVCNELITYIDAHNIKSFYAPLPHPSFLNFPVRWEDTGKTKLAAVMKYVSHCDIKSMTVLDCSDDEGYYARCMDRIGAKATVFLNDDRQETELAALFNRLLYREAVKVERGKLEDLTVNNGFDMIFAVENSIKEAGYSKSELERLGVLCRKHLFMETTCAEEIENIKNCTRSENYKCIHREYSDGKIWELGVYSLRG